MRREKSDNIQSAQAKVAGSRQSDLGNALEKAYFFYILTKECHEENVLYISNRELETARSKVKQYERTVRGKDKSINTDSIWDSASKDFDDKFGKMFKIASLTGQYNHQLAQRCRIGFIALNSAIPGAEKKRTKDF